MDDLTEFYNIVDEEWEFRMQFDPLFATFTGDHRYNDRLPDFSPGNWDAHLQALRHFNRRLHEVNRLNLPVKEQINYSIFKRLLEDTIREDEFGAYFFPISKTAGFHIEFPEIPQFTPLNTLIDYEYYIARLEAFPQFVEDNINLMKEGVKRNFLPVRATLAGVTESILSLVDKEAEQNPLYKPFLNFPQRFRKSDEVRLINRGKAAIVDGVKNAYLKLLTFIDQEYLPSARDSIAAKDLPNGRDFYLHRIRMFTSLELTPESIHQTGLDEVSRIQDEMQLVIADTGHSGDFQSFIEYLRKSPKFYASTREELLSKTALVLKRMDGELPRLFKKLPRTPYGIREIPEHSAPGETTAYYFPPAGDGTRAGNYYVNTYDLPSRPLYEIEALSLHEAVPGHHLQIALQQELEDIPNFRRFGGFTAFVEGWALYAERLGLEVGFYQDSYSNFGRLSYEMWRACRLVVDTGIHALDWSRQQSIEFMSENTSSTLLNITNEVDRYIFWPGQALAYKIGELKIRELRDFAEINLGDRFDLREFHELLLSNGALPLDILESSVQTWVDQMK